MRGLETADTVIKGKHICSISLHLVVVVSVVKDHCVDVLIITILSITHMATTFICYLMSQNIKNITYRGQILHLPADFQF